MKSVGVVICNYNKKEYVLKCIASVFASEFEDFDLFVVDNASTDGSREAIRQQYGTKLTLLENKENLGGSGGFNTGIQKVVEAGYSYLMCLDNDVVVEKHAIGALYDFLREYPNVGMAGSKVYHLQMPEYVQQFGLEIDFTYFGARTLYADQKDNESIPKIVTCDTVAACSVMLPVRVVKEVGGLPEDNFIYWDDMEWGYRVKKAGYEVAAYGESKVWHEMSANVRKETTFSTYYLWRNSLDFFMRNTPKELVERMSAVLLRGVFDAFYESMYRMEYAVGKTIMFAYQDALQGVRGKADPDKIFRNDGNIKVLEEFLKHKDCIFIENDTMDIGQTLQEIKPSLHITENKKEAQIVVCPCDYIMNVTDFSLEKIYIDAQLNIMATEEDIADVKGYAPSLGTFLCMNQPIFLHSVDKLRNNA